MLGNFDEDKPSPAQIRILQSLRGTLCIIYEISPGKIHSHGDLRTTGCPGKNLDPVLRELVRKLKSSAWAKMRAQGDLKSR